jgi:hypothetical protein
MQNEKDFIALAADFSERAADLKYCAEAEQLERQIRELITADNESLFEDVRLYVVELMQGLPTQPTVAEENAEIWRNHLRENR